MVAIVCTSFEGTGLVFVVCSMVCKKWQKLRSVCRCPCPTLTSHQSFVDMFIPIQQAVNRAGLYSRVRKFFISFQCWRNWSRRVLVTALEKQVSFLLHSSQRSGIVFQFLHWNCCLNTKGHHHTEAEIRTVIISFSTGNFCNWIGCICWKLLLSTNLQTRCSLLYLTIDMVCVCSRAARIKGPKLILEAFYINVGFF